MIHFTPIHGTICEIISGAKPECRANFNNMKVIIIKGTAPLGLGYGIGSEADLSDAQAAELIERGYAEATEKTEQVKEATAEPIEEVKKAVSKRK